MTKTKFYKINDVNIYYLESSRRVWNRFIENAIDVQFDGFELSEGNEKLNICIKDYNEIKDSDVDKIVTGNYGYKDGLFIDYRKRNGFRVNDGQLEYWHDLGFNFSLPYIIELYSLHFNKTFIHAAGITKENKAILFPAFGGIGKTLILTELAKRDDVKVLGDDLVLIGNDGKVESYPRPFCIYEYHKSVLSSSYSALNRVRFLAPGILWRIIKRLTLELKIRYGNKISFNNYITYKGGYATVSPFVLFGSDKVECKPVQVEKIVILERSSSATTISLNKIEDRSAASSFAANVTIHEWSDGLKSLLAYYALTGVSISDYCSKVERIINDCFLKADECYILTIPSKTSYDTLIAYINRVI